MDWNQISNYAARHTHTKSWGWGRPGRPADPRATPAAVARKPRCKVRGTGPSLAPAGLPAPLARGQPHSGLGGGFSSASGTRAALSDQRDSQKRAAVATAPEGLSDLQPRGFGCLSLNRGPGAPTALALHSSRAHRPLIRDLLHALSPRAMGFVGVGVAGPLGAGHSHKQARVLTIRNTHRHLLVHTARSLTLQGPPLSLSNSRRPTAHTAAISLLRVREWKEEDRSQTGGGLPRRCGQGVALFSHPGPGCPE